MRPQPCALSIAGDYMAVAFSKGRSFGLFVYKLGVNDKPLHELVGGHTSTVSTVRTVTFRTWSGRHPVVVAVVVPFVLFHFAADHLSNCFVFSVPRSHCCQRGL